MTKLGEFIEEVRLEREHQAERWGGGTERGLDQIDDTKNDENAFVAFIAHHSSRWFPGGFPPHDTDTLLAFRKQMVKVAAIAYAAVRWVDRRLAERLEDADREDQRPSY